MQNFFAILGGMGTLATTNFLTELNKRHSPSKDQDFFNYILFNHAEVPDRTSFILDSSLPSPLPALLDDIRMLDALKPEFIIMPCNTAHYFIDDLQKATSIPLVNMIDETLKAILSLPETVQKIAVIATEGTIVSRLYENRLIEEGFDVILPNPFLQQKVNRLIYSCIKEKGILNLSLYREILSEFQHLGADITLLGCTELSLMNSVDEEPVVPVIDAEKILLDRTVQLAMQMKQNTTVEEKEPFK